MTTMKLDELIEEMQKTWGVLAIRDMDYAIRTFDHALHKIFSEDHQRHMGRTVAGFMIEGLRERGLKSGDHAALTDLTNILQSHIDKGTALYVFSGYWAHHAPRDHCSGSDSDYCEHQVFETARTYTDFGDASHFAWESLHGKIIPECPNHATNAKVDVHLFDGDDLIPLGHWQWDKLFSRLWWANSQRH